MARWDASVQHHWQRLEVQMERGARLFLCARCRDQVLLCSHCDRGQRYCSAACSRQARESAQREAAQRYQRSRRGRMAHAARARRWRSRHRGDAKMVTHQGSRACPADAPLVACMDITTDSAVAPQPGHEEVDACAGVMQAQAAVAGARCRRCDQALMPWVRQGFLRPGRRDGTRITRRDHSP